MNGQPLVYQCWKDYGHGKTHSFSEYKQYFGLFWAILCFNHGKDMSELWTPGKLALALINHINSFRV